MGLWKSLRKCGVLVGTGGPGKPGKAFEIVGVFAHIFEGSPGAPGAGHAPQQIRPDSLHVPSLTNLTMATVSAGYVSALWMAVQF